jgi:hypothetical protein
MSAIFYKVIFKGINQEETPYSLTFRRLNTQKPIQISSSKISTLRNLSETSERVISFQNIQLVIKIGEGIEPYSFNYYIVLLYKTQSEQRMEGFLIGNAKKLGDLLIGIWPFNKDMNITPEMIQEKFNKFIEKNDIDKIALIYS